MSKPSWKKVSLKTKLTASFVAVSVIGGGVANALIDRSVEKSTRAAFEDRLAYESTMLGQMTAGALFGDLDPSDKSLQGPVTALGEAVHTELAVVAKDGTVVADSLPWTPTGPARAGAPDAEIEEARTTGHGVSYRDGRLYVARSIVRDGAVLGYARSSVPTAEIAQGVSEVRTRIGFGALAGLALAVLFGAGVSASLARPIRALSEGAKRVGGGDFTRRIPVESDDDIGELAGSFNEMTSSLERTVADLDKRNRDMHRVLDNVDQALLTLDRDGVIAKERSAAVSEWFGPFPDGTRFVDLLARFDRSAATNFELQWGELRENVMPIELLLEQLPKFLSQGDRRLDITYTPIGADDDPAFPEMLLVITDVTARLAMERAEAEQREIAVVFERTIHDRSAMVEFLLDAETRVRALTAEARPSIVETKRSLHTLKGNAATCGMQRLSTLCHDIETRMAEDGPDISAADKTALAVCWARLVTRISSFVGNRQAEIVIDDDEYARVLRALVDGSPRTEVVRMVHDWRRERAVPRLERLADGARDLATRLNKGNVEVCVAKTVLRTPREEWTPFWSSLTHVVRNAVDHGVESEEERALAGKKGPGTLSLSAERVDTEVVIEIEDNGRGIDWERIADRARAEGLPAETHDDLVNALFADGVSSRTEVTETSGRGVGLGAARDACARLGGYVEVQTELGVGTTFRFHVPLSERTMSLMPTMSRRTKWRPSLSAEQILLPAVPSSPAAALLAPKLPTPSEAPPAAH